MIVKVTTDLYRLDLLDLDNVQVVGYNGEKLRGPSRIFALANKEQLLALANEIYSKAMEPEDLV